MAHLVVVRAGTYQPGERSVYTDRGVVLFTSTKSPADSFRFRHLRPEVASRVRFPRAADVGRRAGSSSSPEGTVRVARKRGDRTSSVMRRASVAQTGASVSGGLPL